MNPYDKRLIGSVVGAVLLAGISGFGIARYTAPSAGIVSSSQEASLVEPAQPDSLTLSIYAIREAGITTAVLQPGGLDADIGAQAVGSPPPSSEEHTSELQ